MLIFLTAVLIVGGVLAQQNPDWFNGAEAVGEAAFWVGIAIGVFMVVSWVVAILAARSARKRIDRRW